MTTHATLGGLAAIFYGLWLRERARRIRLEQRMGRVARLGRR